VVTNTAGVAIAGGVIGAALGVVFPH